MRTISQDTFERVANTTFSRLRFNETDCTIVSDESQLINNKKIFKLMINLNNKDKRLIDIVQNQINQPYLYNRNKYKCIIFNREKLTDTKVSFEFKFKIVQIE